MFTLLLAKPGPPPPSHSAPNSLGAEPRPPRGGTTPALGLPVWAWPGPLGPLTPAVPPLQALGVGGPGYKRIEP